MKRSSAIITIFKKELYRFFKDRRTVVAILLPGLLIYVIYSVMGGAFSNQFGVDNEFKPNIYSVNTPESIKALTASAEIELKDADSGQQEEIKTQITDENCDLLIIFPEDFDKKVAEYDPTSGTEAPGIEIFYNSASTNSTTAYTMITSLLDSYESSMTNKFDVNHSADIKFDLASERDLTSAIFSMLMPMLLIVLLFSGCLAVAPESIAGEKERGTIASMLITPAKRSDIAIGKILALSLLALISGASSTLGIILSFPKLMGGAVELNGAVYSVTDYLLLAVVILSTVLVLITLTSIVSAFAKSVKEANGYVTPIMIIAMLVGVTGMFGNGAAQNHMLYAIPLYNSVQCMIGIFSFDINLINIIVTVAANIVLTALGVLVLTKMFNSEKVMFNK